MARPSRITKFLDKIKKILNRKKLSKKTEEMDGTVTGMTPTVTYYRKGLTPFMADACKRCHDRYACWLSICTEDELLLFMGVNKQDDRDTMARLFGEIILIDEICEKFPRPIALPYNKKIEYISFKCNLFTIKERWVKTDELANKSGGYWDGEITNEPLKLYQAGKLWPNQKRYRR